MGQEANLSPCPFCGGTDLRVETWDVQPDDWHSGHVRCADCDAQGASPGEWLDDDAEAHEAAIAAWNRRSSTPESSAKSVETGWLIEEWDSRADIFKARWWALGLGENGEWTMDSTAALRFARAADAQAYIDDIGWTEAKPTEHRWG